MENKNIFSEFEGLYPVKKTLRFELKPWGKTADYLAETIDEDKKRDDSYKEAKKLLDEYYKVFLSTALKGFKFKNLDEYLQNQNSDKKAIKAIEKKLRTELFEHIKKNKNYSKLFNKTMIEEIMPEFLKEYPEKVKIIKEFDKFTTYFSDFWTNRKNIFSAEEISTSFTYRLINQNLPKFLDNTRSFQIVAEKMVDEIIVNEFNLGVMALHHAT